MHDIADIWDDDEDREAVRQFSQAKLRTARKVCPTRRAVSPPAAADPAGSPTRGTQFGDPRP